MKLTDMKRDGHPISAEGQAKALREWFSGADLGYSGLAAIMQRLEPVNDSWAHHRNADGLVQKLRKAGVIEYIGGSWHICDEYADNIDAIVQSWL